MFTEGSKNNEKKKAIKLDAVRVYKYWVAKRSF